MLDVNQATDTPTKTLVEDIIREKFYIHLDQELPYIIRQVIYAEFSKYVDIYGVE